MKRLLALVLAVFLQSASAQPGPEVWMLTLYSKGDTNGNCEANAEAIGQSIQDAFDDAVPGFTPYDPLVDDVASARFLRSGHAQEQRHRELAIKLCARSFCQKPRNWQACLWNGCNCACGRGRRELVSWNAGDVARILKAKRDLDVWVRAKGVELGCELGLVMEKMRG